MKIRRFMEFIYENRSHKYTDYDIIKMIGNIGYGNVTELRKENEALFRAAYRHNALGKIKWPYPLPMHLSDDELINLIIQKGYKSYSDIPTQDKNLILQIRRREINPTEKIPGWKNPYNVWHTMDKEEITRFLKDNGYIHKIDVRREYPGLYNYLLSLGIDDYNEWVPKHSLSQTERRKNEREGN